MKKWIKVNVLFMAYLTNSDTIKLSLHNPLYWLNSGIMYVAIYIVISLLEDIKNK